MKNHRIFYVFLISTILLMMLSISELRKSPLSIFVLKGSEGNVDAYSLKISMTNSDMDFKPITLSAEDQKQGGEALQSKEIKTLTAFSNHFGKWSFALGMPGGEESWPGYFGGGIRGFLQKEQPEYFDDLQLLDRLFLSLLLKTSPSIPLLDSDKTVVAIEQKPAITPGIGFSLVPTPVIPISQGVVRVEILNGCGITNAADWAAKRLKGNGITIVGKDNADNFQYTKTIVQSAAGSPVALEEALDRLGLSKESVVEITNPPASADVIVIVGKDFRKLKERLRDRTHH